MRHNTTCLTISLLLILTFTAFGVAKRNLAIHTAPTSNASVASNLSEKTPIESWTDRLGELEGCSTLGTPDSGSLSYGHWCFKEPTWIWMFGEYNEATNAYPQIEEEEYMNLIGDNGLQREVVIWNIKKEPNRDWHWSPVKTHL